VGPLTILRAVMDFCFPWTCPVCRAGFEGPGPLCAACTQQLSDLEDEPCCPACATSLPMHDSPCPYCRGKGWPHFERVVRLTSYHDPTRALILHLKYHRGWPAGEQLAQRLLAQESVKALMHETQVLVPVPLHWRRQFARGYNQADVVARWLGAKCKIPVAHPVRRTRDTETQTHLHSHAKRESNLKNAFALTDPRAVAGRHVTIVDDVWTTGATLQALARALKPARPASLSALVIAAADPRGVERGPEGHRIAGVEAPLPHGTTAQKE
jgi:ComF family protein